MKNKKIIIVMPAYFAEKTLEKTYNDIPLEYRKNIIVVDDASKDKTVEVAKKLGLKTIVHKNNLGYGGNQKTCYKEALKMGADIVVMLHPDFQYDARMIPALVRPIEIGWLDFMMGNRVRSRKESLSGGMPVYKYLFNRSLTILENILLGQNLGEFHSGFRAYSAKVLKTLPFDKFSNDFVFDQQFIVSAVNAGFKIAEIPVQVRYFTGASSISFKRSVTYGLGAFFTVFQYLLKRWGFANPKIFNK
ncbi:MAG: glycosyltransferase family 2 protein [Candidatus Nealsonbacteria bacterium]